MSSKKYLIELLKDKYLYEFERKNKFDDLNLPITLLSLLLASVYFVLTEVYNKSESKIFDIIILVLCLLIVIVSLFSLSTLLYVFFSYNRRYCSFPDSSQVLERFEIIREHFGSKDETVIESLEDDIFHWYKECNTNNSKVNDSRSNAMFTFRMLLSIAFCLGAILMLVIVFFKY